MSSAPQIPNIGGTLEADMGVAAHTKPLAWRQGDEGFQRWLEGKTAADLDVVEAGGRDFYPETLRKVVKGQAREIDVLMRVPNNQERVCARRDALRLVRTWLALPKDAPPLTVPIAHQLCGEDYWLHVDNLCLLSYALHDPKPVKNGAGDVTYVRHMLPAYLDNHYPPTSLYDALERLDWYAQQEDPRMGEIDEKRFTALILAIDKRRNLSPLVAIGGRARESFVLSMASRLAPSLTPKSSSLFTETPTPA